MRGGGRPEEGAPVEHPVSQKTLEEPNSLHPPAKRSPQKCEIPGDHGGGGAPRSAPCWRDHTWCEAPGKAWESLRRGVEITRETRALSIQQGDLDVWTEEDHDTVFRYLCFSCKSTAIGQ